jgi:hypothetical protein
MPFGFSLLLVLERAQGQAKPLHPTLTCYRSSMVSCYRGDKALVTLLL